MSEEKKDFKIETESDIEETEIDSSDEKEITEKESDSGSGKLENTVYEWGRCLVTAVVGVVLLFVFCVRMIGVSGGSMQNTLYTGDRVLMLNSAFCKYEQGDIVVINAYNSVLDDTIIKRVIAVGGQTVDIDFLTGTVYVDGDALDEPYIKERTYTTEGTQFPLTLAPDEVFVMGDNRNASTDSRSSMLGAVKVDYIQGEAFFLLIPGKTASTDKMDWSRFGFID